MQTILRKNNQCRVSVSWHYSRRALAIMQAAPNHTLPTNGYARSYSGVSVDSFVKKITFQKLSEEGLKILEER